MNQVTVNGLRPLTMRQGRHPRQGRTPATDDETKDIRAQNLDGEDLGNTDAIFDELFPPLREGGSEPSDVRRVEPDEDGLLPADTNEPVTPDVQSRAVSGRIRMFRPVN